MKCHVHTPDLGHTVMEPTPAFGAAVWLPMQMPKVCDLALHPLERLILSPQDTSIDVPLTVPSGQGWKPHVWLSYAEMNPLHMKLYVANASVAPSPKAWRSGDRLWMLHLMGSHGYGLETHHRLRTLFANKTAKTLSPRSRLWGRRVCNWRIAQCTPSMAQTYWLQRPSFI